jgi:hypothetical protein
MEHVVRAPSGPDKWARVRVIETSPTAGGTLRYRFWGRDRRDGLPRRRSLPSTAEKLGKRRLESQAVMLPWRGWHPSQRDSVTGWRALRHAGW